MKHSVTLVTCPRAAVAKKIAKALVEERLAACVTLVPGVTSVYAWKGALCADAEILLVIKSRADRHAAIARRVKALHPYTVPEIVHLPIAAGSADYLGWIDESVG